MAKCLKIPLTCYIPQNANVMKIQKIRDNGATLEEVPGDRNKAELYARKIATDNG